MTFLRVYLLMTKTRTIFAMPWKLSSIKCTRSRLIDQHFYSRLLPPWQPQSLRNLAIAKLGTGLRLWQFLVQITYDQFLSLPVAQVRTTSCWWQVYCGSIIQDPRPRIKEKRQIRDNSPFQSRQRYYLSLPGWTWSLHLKSSTRILLPYLPRMMHILTCVCLAKMIALARVPFNLDTRQFS